MHYERHSKGTSGSGGGVKAKKESRPLRPEGGGPSPSRVPRGGKTRAEKEKTCQPENVSNSPREKKKRPTGPNGGGTEREIRRSAYKGICSSIGGKGFPRRRRRRPPSWGGRRRDRFKGKLRAPCEEGFLERQKGSLPDPRRGHLYTIPRGGEKKGLSGLGSRGRGGPKRKEKGILTVDAHRQGGPFRPLKGKDVDGFQKGPRRW